MKKIILLLALIISTVVTAQELNRVPATNVTEHKRVSGFDGNLEISESRVAAPNETVTPTGTSTEVGITEGSLSVSLSGAANYTIPILVPKGINGVEPKISLDYSSQSGNGMAGYGWNIGGLSAITRIPSTQFHDGIIDPVDGDDLDRFALDGQRLILKNPNGTTYLFDGAIFETENFSNIKITYITPSQGFLVEYPDGSSANYGNFANQNITTYAITLWRSSVGISIKYTYIIENNFIRIDSVSYCLRWRQTALNKISFYYTERLRPEESYVNGTLVLNNKILNSIIITSGSEYYRIYNLVYDTTTLGGENNLNYQRLSKITESIFEIGMSKSYNPTVFTYGNTPETIISGGIAASLTVGNISILNAATVSGDFNGDGKIDFLLYPTVGSEAQSKYWMFIENTYSSGVISDRLHNVGLFEKIFSMSMLNYSVNNNYKMSQQQGWCVVKKSGLQNTFTSYLYDTYTSYSSYPTDIIPQYTRTFNLPSSTPLNRTFDYFNGDFNGDGLTDVVILEKNSNLRSSYFVDLDRRLTSNYSSFSGDISATISSNIYIEDANGDGKSDLLVFSEGSVKVYSLNNTNQFTLLWEIFNSNISLLSNKIILMGDYNGDGKSDFLIPAYVGASLWHMFHSTGTSFKYSYKNYPEFFYLPSGSDYSAHYISSDFNNDGKSDISKMLFNSSGTASISCFPNKNGGFLGTYGDVYYGLTPNIAGIDKQNLPFFYNSTQPNENLEVGFIRDNKIYTFKAFKDFGKDKLLNTITTGNGVKEAVTYKPLKEEYYNPNIYTPANTADSQYYPNVDIFSSPSFNVVSKLERFGNNYKNQFYSYYGGVYAMNGLGFLGFQEVLKTNWFNIEQPNQYMLSSVSRFDMSLRGANTLNFTTENYWTNMGQVPSYCIQKTTNTYNIENGVFTDPLLANKVFKLKKTKVENFDGLKNISSENNFVYNVFNNPISSTGIIKNGTAVEQTSTANITYDGLLASPYTVDRPTKKIESVTAYSDTRTSEEQFTYNAQNLVLTNKKKSMSSDFITITYDYDIYGNAKKQTVSSIDLPADRVTNYEFDPIYYFRFLTKVTDLEGLATTYTYNNNKGTLLTETNPYGLMTTYTYDAWGKKTSVKDYLNNIATLAYTKTANNTFTTTQTMPATHGGESLEVVDVLGRKIISGSKNIQGVFSYIKTDFDNLDRVVKQYEPYFLNSQDLYNFSPTLFSQTTYDDYRRMSGMTYSSGKTETIVYNLLTTTVTTTADGLTNTKLATSDTMGNTINTIEAPIGGTINHQYFANSVLKSTSYANNLITMQQDNWGRKSQMIDPSAGTYNYTYNNLGEIKTEETPKGLTTYGYDNFGKVLTKTVVGKATTVPPTTTNTLTTNVYNATTKLLDSMSFNDIENNMVTNYDYKYNSYQQPRLVTETNAMTEFQTEIFYDSFGRPLNQRQKAATLITGTANINKSSEKWTTNVYQNGDLFKVTDGITNNGSGAILWQTNELNQRDQLTKGQFGNGIFVQNTYDGVTFNLSNQNHSNSTTVGGTSYFQMSYNWGSFPQRNLYTSRTFHHNNNYVENFIFDNLNRLTSFPNELGVLENQTYAENGRIDTNSNGTYNYASTIRPYRNTSLEVNVASKNYYLNNALQQINYSALKKPISIYQETTTGVAKERIDFLYNSGESRSTMFYGDTNTNKMSRKFRRYYSQGGTMEITEERDGSGNIIATDFVTYIAGDAYSAPIILKSDGANQNYLYLHRDNLGSILAISDQNKNILERRMFDAWGNLVKLQNAAGQFVINNGQTLIANYKILLDRGYTGHEHLFGIGLINMNGRLYDPKLRRFLMPDNNLQDPTNSQNYNRYGYVLNNPLIYIDPTGEEGGPGDGTGGQECANCGIIEIIIGAVVGSVVGSWNFISSSWDKSGIKDWSNRNMNFNEWTDSYKQGVSFLEKNYNSAINDVKDFFSRNFNIKKSSPKVIAANSYSSTPSGGNSPNVSSASTSPGMGYNNNVEMHSYTPSQGNIHMPTQHTFLGVNMTGLSEGNFFQQAIYGTANSFNIVSQYMMGRGVGDSSMRNLNGTATTTDEGVMAFGSMPLYAAGGGSVAKTTLTEGTHVVYQGFNKAGIVEYVGITGRDAAVRFAEHLSSGTARALLQYRVVPGATGLSNLSARILEQNLINKFNLKRLLNVRNSLAKKYWVQYGIKP